MAGVSCTCGTQPCTAQTAGEAGRAASPGPADPSRGPESALEETGHRATLL